MILLRLLASLIVVLMLLAAPRVQAQAPDSLAHQGLLTDPAGTPVPDAAYSITFALYPAPTGGSPVWTEARTVTTEGGLYSVYLGAVTSLAGVAFDRPLWLGIQVEADPEMTPRTPLVAAPYALGLRALRVTPETAGDGPNMIGGSIFNSVAAGVVGATVGGGGDPDFNGFPNPNTVSADYGTVGGGLRNRAQGVRSTVGGGGGNVASSDDATVAGGTSNTAAGTDAAIGGGLLNRASGSAATVGGGDSNTASGVRATIGGGFGNAASGLEATVPGGFENQARGDRSLAVGFRARAAHEATFVWNDVSADSLVSTASNQFLVRAAGGLGLNTNAPDRELTVFDGDADGDAALNLRATAGAAREMLLAVNQSSGGILSMETPNDLGFRTDGVTRMRIKADGLVGIGTSAPTSPLTVAGAVESTAGGFVFPDGSVQTTAATGGGVSTWLLGGNAGTDPATDFLGTTDATPLEIRVGAAQVMRYEPETADDGPNVIGGHSGNSVAAGVVGATIAGGGDPDDLGPRPNQVTGDYGTVGGGRSNTAGGSDATIGGGFINTASGVGATLAGGSENTASGFTATVGGGNSNTASGSSAVVSGGFNNIASGQSAMIAGGSSNRARGDFSFAAGFNARAAHDGAFVWNDRSSIFSADSLASTAENQFLVRAAGGLGLNTAAPTRELTVFDRDANGDAALNLRATAGQEREMLLAVNQSSGGIISMQTNNDLFFRTNGTNRMVIASGGKVGIGRTTAVHPLHVGTDATNGNGAHLTIGGTWTNGSSRLFKEGFEPVDAEAVLAGVASLEISRWRYRGAEGEGAHLGPVAEEFAAAFGLGSDDRYIATVDADGVALAAIQGLLQRNETLEARVADLEARVASLEAAVEALLSAYGRRAP